MTNTTTSAAVASAGLAALLDSASGGLVADLLKQIDDAAAVEKKGGNAAVRKAAVRSALAASNKLALAEINAAAAQLTERGERIAAFAEAVQTGGLDEDQAVLLLQAHLDDKLLIEAATAVNELIRQLVFRAMDIAAEADGEEFPEHTAMIIDVPGTGKRFCREGVGRKPAEVDFDALRDAVGDEVFASITCEQVKVTRVLDEAGLAAAVLDNPDLLEQVRSAVIPGDWKPARLMVRDTPKEE